MTDSLFDSNRIEPMDFPQEEIRAILTWLDMPPLLNVAEELLPLRNHLAALREIQIPPEQRTVVLGFLFTRSVSIVANLLPSLSGVSFPIHRKTRQLIRSLQDLLRTMAEDLLAIPHTIDGELVRGFDLTLWRGLYSLAQHLLISNLAASPAGVGIWQQLHQAYETALDLEVANHTPEGASSSLKNVYYSAVLLGYAQPASFTSREVDFVATYLKRFADQIDPIDESASKTRAAFWIDPVRDAAAVACSRKVAPPDTPVRYYSCTRLAVLLRRQLAALEAGSLPELIDLPDFAGTPAGHGVLRRLITYWGEPGKRRFQRRRQHYRAVLCAGLDSLWRLFQDEDAASIETSSWMITNESPDGYAVMHVSGKTGGMSVGDVTAIRTETGEDWQICIVRWALSENQEHLELGLQILATRAVPAFLALPVEAPHNGHLSVLILPEIPALRPTEMLVVPSGALENQKKNLVLVVERKNIEVREVRSTHLEEQNSHIEVFSIEPDTLSA